MTGKVKELPTYIDDEGNEQIDYLAMHESDADMQDMLLDLERSVLREEGDEEGLAILDEEAEAIRNGKEEEYYNKLRAVGVDNV